MYHIMAWVLISVVYLGDKARLATILNQHELEHYSSMMTSSTV